MKRVILGVACISAGVLVAVGCSSNDSNGGTPAIDSGVVVADTAPPAQDAKPPVKPDAKPEVDSGPPVPSCYSLPPVNAAGDKATAEQVVQALSNPAAYDYHAPLARRGGCSSADITQFVAAVEAKNAANNPPTFAGQFLNQLDTSGVVGVSDSCKECILSEYASPNSPSVLWGVSGARATSTRAQEAPANLTSINTLGCTQVRGATTEAQARALHRGNACGAVLCQSCTSQADFADCSSYSLSDGACRSFKADFDAAVSAAAPLTSPGGSCSDLGKVVDSFCGNAGGGAADAGIGQ